MVELEICSKFSLRELKILLYFYVFLSNQITFTKSWKKLYEDSLLRRRFIYYRYSTVIISMLLHRQIVWGLRRMMCVEWSDKTDFGAQLLSWLNVWLYLMLRTPTSQHPPYQKYTSLSAMCRTTCSSMNNNVPTKTQ